MTPAARWQTLGIALCLAVLLGLSVSFALLLSHNKVQPEQADVVVYYSVGRLVRDGHGGSIYSWPAVRAMESVVAAHFQIAQPEGSFLYPPFFATAMGGVAFLPYRWAYALWTFLNVLLLCTSLYALQKYARFSTRGTLLLWLAGLSYFSVFATVIQGQSSILLLAGLTFCFTAWRTGHYTLAGSVVALGLLKPTIIVPALVLMVVRGEWRVLRAFGLVAVALFLLPAPFLGWRVDGQYFGILRKAADWHSTPGFI